MRKHWGWGRAEQALTAEQLQEAAPGVVEYLGFGRTDVEIPVALEAASLPVPRLTPGDLSDIADTGRHARATGVAAPRGVNASLDLPALRTQVR